MFMLNLPRVNAPSCSAIVVLLKVLTSMKSTEPIVTIQDGQLKGTVGENLDGEKFFKFLGIPYAKPPIKGLRFLPPEPIEPWQGVRDATKIAKQSISKSEITMEIEGDEDCLYLNVFTKHLCHCKLRPVMVYFHGGGLIFGSSNPNLYGPEYLLTKDIVLVTVTYRLGALGFLSIEGTNVTGNMGLKDQNLALKWVQQNIKYFKGDPNNVTIFGESAGGSSVHAHILSPLSKGLFHKAILQSGSILNPWFWGKKNLAREIVTHMGKTANTEQEALDFLRLAPAIDIYTAQNKLYDCIYADSERPLSAVLEPPSKSAFLSKGVREIMMEGSYNQVPMMFGYTDTEGMLVEGISAYNIQTPPLELSNIIPYELEIEKGSNHSKEIIDMFGKIYSNLDKSKTDVYNAVTDSNFLAGIIESVLTHVKTANHSIYVYRVSISTKLNRLKAILKKLDEPGAYHMDELGYLFRSSMSPKIEPGSVEDKAVRNFVDIWTDFAEYGNPNPNNHLGVVWKPVESKENIPVLDIGRELEVKDIPERNRLKVWWDVYQKWQPKSKKF